MWKWPVVKYNHIKIKPKICVLFVFDLDDKRKLVKNKTLKHYSDLRSMFLVDTLVGRIGGDSVSVLIYCPQSTGVWWCGGVWSWWCGVCVCVCVVVCVWWW